LAVSGLITEPTATNFDLNGTNESNLPEVNIIEKDIQSTNLSAELLRIHHRMGHAPFTKLQELAKQGTLPARLKNCPILMCTACAYRKASRKAWRGKMLKNLKTNPTHVQPGDMVLVDQMVSPMLGLVAQIPGILTTKRYNYATVYVDQATRMGYVHLQKSATKGSPVYVLESTLQKQGIYGKWKSRANIGIYLGVLPHHSRNVALVLNRDTRLVSPQFHVQHDHCYHTVREEKQKSPDLWMIKAGFVSQKEALQTQSSG
jgi:hypothetical protein